MIRGVKMRKLIALFIVAILVLLIFAAGCAKEDTGKKLVSRPVQAKPIGAPSAPPVDEPEAETDVYVEPEVEEEVVPQAGLAFCEQLSGADIAEVFGGTWSKTADCPQRPQMPAGVDVCRCDYDGPKQIYVSVEAQLYDSADEAERVYNMYCQGTAEESEVGTYSCREERTDPLRPNYVHFLKGNNFVKVSCLGGSCPLNSVAELAKKVDAEI
jgi:hypothetical protein